MHKLIALMLTAIMALSTVVFAHRGSGDVDDFDDLEDLNDFDDLEDLDDFNREFRVRIDQRNLDREFRIRQDGLDRDVRFRTDNIRLEQDGLDRDMRIDRNLRGDRQIDLREVFAARGIVPAQPVVGNIDPRFLDAIDRTLVSGSLGPVDIRVTEIVDPIKGTSILNPPMSAATVDRLVRSLDPGTVRILERELISGGFQTDPTTGLSVAPEQDRRIRLDAGDRRIELRITSDAGEFSRDIELRID